MYIIKQPCHLEAVYKTVISSKQMLQFIIPLSLKATKKIILTL